MTPDQQTIAFQPQDPRVGAEEAKRLSRQAAEILGRLNRGPATNTELREITHRFGARIHDLRAAGFRIETYDRDAKTGVCWYRLSLG